MSSTESAISSFPLPRCTKKGTARGVFHRGPFLESLNWAQIYRLPVLFVCEDNRISATTPTGPMTAGDGVSARAAALGIGSIRLDGNDVEAVDEAARQLVAEVRDGGGPRFLHAVTYRFKGHVSVDPGTYRDPAEVEAALKFDPLLVARRKWIANGNAGAALDQLDSDARAEIDAALAIAEAAPWPEPGAAYEDIADTGAGVWR